MVEFRHLLERTMTTLESWHCDVFRVMVSRLEGFYMLKSLKSRTWLNLTIKTLNLEVRGLITLTFRSSLTLTLTLKFEDLERDAGSLTGIMGLCSVYVRGRVLRQP